MCVVGAVSKALHRVPVDVVFGLHDQISQTLTDTPGIKPLFINPKYGQKSSKSELSVENIDFEKSHKNVQISSKIKP